MPWTIEMLLKTLVRMTSAISEAIVEPSGVGFMLSPCVMAMLLLEPSWNSAASPGALPCMMVTVPLKSSDPDEVPVVT